MENVQQCPNLEGPTKRKSEIVSLSGLAKNNFAQTILASLPAKLVVLICLFR